MKNIRKELEKLNLIEDLENHGYNQDTIVNILESEDSKNIIGSFDTVEELMENLHGEDDDFDFNWKGLKPTPKCDEEFASNIFNLIQDLIIKDDIITEKFISKNCLNAHYAKHCLAGNPNKKFTETSIYYDFNDPNRYRIYGEGVKDKIKNCNHEIPSLYDTKLVNKYFRKLFEGNYQILFNTSCGFKNNSGNVIIGLNAFSSNVTKNYSGGNTIDIMIANASFKIISVYPVDAYYLESKFNNIIKKYNSTSGVKLKINN